jgi:hypothetical protein
MVCKGRLNPLVAAAAVVLFTLTMVSVAAFVFLAIVFCMAALVIGVFVVAVVFSAFFMAAVMVRIVVMAVMLREGVVVLGAAHGAGFEAIAELYAADAGNGKYGVGNL